MIQVIAVHMEGGEHVQHIAQLRWVEVAQPGARATGQPKDVSRQGMVDFVLANPGQAFVLNPAGTEYALLQAVGGFPPYVRTAPDDTTSDNLLSLPRF